MTEPFTGTALTVPVRFFDSINFAAEPELAAERNWLAPGQKYQLVIVLEPWTNWPLPRPDQHPGYGFPPLPDWLTGSKPD